MATITLRGNSIETIGNLPAVGAKAPDFKLVKQDLSRVTLKDFPGKKVLNIFPSIDTPVCAASVRKFNEAASKKGLTVLCISEDLPFAAKRFCGAENLDKVVTLSAMKSSFGKDYGVEIISGGMTGLCSRAIVVLDENDTVIHAEQVPEIAQEPNYEAALAKL